MRLKEKLNEAKLTNDKTDEILLRSVASSIFLQIKSSIGNYMYQIDIPEGVDKKWKTEKERLAYRTILKNLSKMEREIK